MPTLDLSFGDVGSLPPDGNYRLVVNDAIYKANRAGDGYIIEMDCWILDAPDEKWDGFKPWPKPNASLKTSARWKLQEALEAITQREWKEDNLQLEVDDDMKVPELIGKTFIGVCMQGEFANRSVLKVDTFLRDDGTTKIGETVNTAESGI